MILLLLLPFSCCFIFTHCYNVNVDNVVVYTKPKYNVTGRGSYFGYSLILHKDWILVGAPRANSSILGESVMEPGVVYRCKLKERCKEVKLEKIGNEQRYTLKAVKDLKNNSWIGGSMDMEEREDGHVVVCGHRWKNQKIFDRDNPSYSMTGLCYSSDSSFTQDFKILLPSRLYSQHEDIYYKGEVRDSQLGMSLSIARQSRDQISLIIGAPGVGPYWSGGIVQYVSESLGNTPVRRKREVYFGEFQNPTFVWRKTGLDTKLFSYFGYQVTSGFFFEQGYLNFVTSAPRGAGLKGYVWIYNIYMKYGSSTPSIKKHNIIEGSTIGEYFGASMTVADVNGDGLDELIVGAPMFSLEGDEGRIYIFSKYSQFKLYEMDKKTGFHIGGRFGTSLASLGDIDQDFYDDIAVGSPYEENGVIYIYNGSPNGLKQKFSQRIAASAIDNSLRGFGISISRPTDIDANMYKDFVVGAYLSEHVILFRTQPTIELFAQLHNPPELDLNQTIIFVRACFKYSGSNAPNSVEIVRNLEVDINFQRFDAVPSKNLTLQGNNTWLCEDIKIKMKERFQKINLDLTDDVDISVSQNLNYVRTKEKKIIWMQDKNIEYGDSFCGSCPVLRKSHSARVVIPYRKYCRDGGCRSDVQLHCELHQGNSSEKIISYIIGSNPLIKLIVDISNFGDTLYSGYIIINIPKEVNLAQIPFLCQDEYINNSLFVTCKLGAIMNRMMKQINISLQLSSFDKLRHFSESGQFLSFRVETQIVRNHVDLNLENNICNLKLDLSMHADMHITGKSDKEVYTYEALENDVKEVRVEPSIIHTYEVSNIGVSPLREVQTILSIPSIWTKYKQNVIFAQSYIEAYQNSKAVLCSPLEISGDLNKQVMGKDSCDFNIIEKEWKYANEINYTYPLNLTHFLNCSSMDISCSQYMCNFSEFTSDTYVKLTITTTLNVSLLEPLLGQKNIIYFATYGCLQVNGAKNIHFNENMKHSTIVPSPVIGTVPPKEVDMWIYIVCIIAGILLLLLAAFALMKLGFFKREKKEELKALKLSDGCASN